MCQDHICWVNLQRQQQCLDFTIWTHLAASNNLWFSFLLKLLVSVMVDLPLHSPGQTAYCHTACIQGETCILCRVQYRIFLLKNHTRLIFSAAADADLPPPQSDAKDEVPRRPSASLMACKRHLWQQVQSWWGNPELSRLMWEKSLHDPWKQGLPSSFQN